MLQLPQPTHKNQNAKQQMSDLTLQELFLMITKHFYFQ